MPNDAFSQTALSDDPHFLIRLKNACLVVALEVIAEDPGVPSHPDRLELAKAMLSTPTLSAKFAPFMVNRPNVLNFATSYDFAQATVVTASGDADLHSQVAADWTTFTTLP